MFGKPILTRKTQSYVSLLSRIIVLEISPLPNDPSLVYARGGLGDKIGRGRIIETQKNQKKNIKGTVRSTDNTLI